MWDNWKKKIKRLFISDEENHRDEDMQQPDRHHPEAKMMYQYPAKKSFRFPVVPDKGNETNQHRSYSDKNEVFENRSNPKTQKPSIQEHTYSKSTEDDVSKYDTPAFRRRNHNHFKPRHTTMQGYKDEHSKHKVYKKNPDQPFRPTEVPSPIYGFRPRNENKAKVIEEVPAYKRKQETDPFKDLEILKEGPSRTEINAVDVEVPAYQRKQAIEDVKKLANSEIQNEGYFKGNTKETNVEQKETINDLKEEGTYQSASMEKHEKHTDASTANEQNHIPSGSFNQKDTEEQVETKQESAATVVKEERSDDDQQKEDERTNQTKTEPKRESRLSQRRRQQQMGQNNVPFNVMMTPRDKKNLWDRTKQKHNKNAEETRPSQWTNEATDMITEHNAVQEIPLHLLNDIEDHSSDDKAWLDEQQQLLEQTLKYFNVQAKVVNVTQGPSVTRFEVQPQLGVKVSKVRNLSDDLKLNMAAKDIRIEAPIPGKNTIGIEIPNRKPQMVGLQGVFATEAFKKSNSPLTIALGLSIEGEPFITNIQKMPHGLIAGATGSGKSVCINTILISLLYKAHHEEVKFLLIDPKMVELAPYNGIPHLVSPVITDVKAATAALKWAVAEMEERYEKFVHEGVRDIERYNEKMVKQQQMKNKLPFIVIVIDELADLMMVSPQDVEDAISRIAQKARACGIHLILATQRPSVDVITGLIKANIPTRIAFSVSSQVDSRTILDTSGAEKLLGKGDMLFIENGSGKTVRLQGPFVSDDEIDRVASYARSIAPANYLFEQEQLLEQIHTEEEEDELLKDAILFVLEQNGASTSLLQRHFKIGYNRAARLIDTLEQRGIISGQNGSKPREVLVTSTQVEDMI